MSPEELLTKKNIHYIPKGADLVIRCLSPDHEDRNPSLRVDKFTGVFNCLSCGFKGNLFEHYGQKANFLTMKRQKLKNKIQTKLAENVGLEMPVNAVPFQREWRNIDEETFRKFQAFEHSDSHFIGRVVFPIRAISGKIVGFIGRHMTANHDPKYLIHPPGVQLPLFPPNPEFIDGRIILVEGIFDMLNLYDKGLTNVVCAFGTRKLSKDKQASKDKLNLFKLRGMIGVDIFFDGDDAGQNAAAEVKELCEDYLDLDTRNVNYANTDPGDLTASQVLRLKERLYG